MLNLLLLHLSCSQDSELSYAHRDGRLLELIDEAWQKDELPYDGTLRAEKAFLKASGEHCKINYLKDRSVTYSLQIFLVERRIELVF